jgi:hypothetical protein
MSAQPQESPLTLSPGPSADDGPVQEIAPGFDSRALKRVEDEEERFALERDGAPE